ncbi:MAG: nuclear transport factor 2 family protein [bacterium]|nr:nuclear transport factor 2 family protein [bacterium]MCY3891045.1 nuclear transport factor 2 family protein [bacterium]MCY4133466.1 nuclear transport factor 2 family protein [bacterium]
MSDELAIRNIVARLAMLSDGGDLEEYVDLFTDDARWDMPGGELQGRDNLLAGAIERRAAGTVGPGSNTRHVIATQTVEVDGDEAVSDAYFQFWVHTATEPSIALFGTYQDRLVRTGDGWKLAHRVISFG